MADLRPSPLPSSWGKELPRDRVPGLHRCQGHQKNCHIAWERRGKAQEFAAERVLKTEEPGVEGLTANFAQGPNGVPVLTDGSIDSVSVTVKDIPLGLGSALG